jgi:penicillin-binding protein 1B
MLKKIFIGFLIGIVIITAGLVIYGWHLSLQVDKRFSARRWSIPSKVYSDTTLLYPGQRIDAKHFRAKLIRLGYHKVSGKDLKKGEVRFVSKGVHLFMNDLQTPWNSRSGLPVSIVIRNNRIDSIVRTDNGDSIPILELEPEEITLFFRPERERRRLEPEEITLFFRPERERRRLVSIKQVPEHLKQAVMAAEDGRFYSHHGIDPRGLMRALITNLKHAKIRQGGSTITQQLAKNYFLTPAKTITRKSKEIILSLVIEFQYEKDEILEIYLNEIYLGQRGATSINGVGEAAWFYFGKSVSELSRAESAAIAGLIKAPNHYSPYKDPERCRIRRNSVLQAMHTKGWITEQELQADSAGPAKTSGFTVSRNKAPYFVDYLAEQLSSLYRPEDLTSLGLEIYTTLDTQVQAAAEAALTKGLAHLEKQNPALRRNETDRKLQGAVVVMQPKTGYVLAMVGGRDYGTSQFNRIVQAKRQPGSAFKPFVYLAGLDRFSPTTLLSNQPKTYTIDGQPWEPRNFEPVTTYTVSMRNALQHSYNLATVDLALKTGLDRIVALTQKLHFSTVVKPYPSLALGAFEVKPIELARAYCVFAAEGVQPFALALKGVVDENDRTLNQKHLKIERLISPAKAFIINSMLESVVIDGTARSLKLRGINWPVAGKTGTTNDFRDAWFVGYTPDILALVWVGFDNGDPILATGSAAALPIWAELMKSIPQYRSEKGFNQPPGVEKRTVCAVTGLLVVENGCPEPLEEYFLSEHVPIEKCQLHRKAGLSDLIKGVKKYFNAD